MNIYDISQLHTLGQQVSRDQNAGYADGDLQAEVAKLQKAFRDSVGTSAGRFGRSKPTAEGRLQQDAFLIQISYERSVFSMAWGDVLH